MRRLLIAAAWLAAAIVIALGAAGIVAALDHLPGSAGRPELTWDADRAAAVDLDRASANAQALAAVVAQLGDDGRAALAALVASDTAALTAAIASGTSQLDAIDAAVATLRASTAGLPMDRPDRVVRYSPAVLARYDALVGAVDAVAPLRSAWERLAGGVVPAQELGGHLIGHDAIAGEAVKLGGAGSYAKAIARIDAATAELAAARIIRDRLAAAVDVTTLDQWISANTTYDAALRDLWTALLGSHGRVTDGVRSAITRERAAKDLLPPDARALVVILGDVARGGLNQAVITIEEARGRLLQAVRSFAARSVAGRHGSGAVTELDSVADPSASHPHARLDCRAVPGRVPFCRNPCTQEP